MLNTLGNLHRHPNRMEEARKESQEVRKIDRELAQKNPETYLPNLAKKLNNPAKVDNMQNRIKQARKEYEEALKIDRELAHKNPETYLIFQLMLSTESGGWSGLQRFYQPSSYAPPCKKGACAGSLASGSYLTRQGISSSVWRPCPQYGQQLRGDGPAHDPCAAFVTIKPHNTAHAELHHRVIPA